MGRKSKNRGPVDAVEQVIPHGDVQVLPELQERDTGLESTPQGESESGGDEGAQGGSESEGMEDQNYKDDDDSGLDPPDGDEQEDARTSKRITKWLGRAVPHACPECKAVLLDDRATKACVVTQTRDVMNVGGRAVQDRYMICNRCNEAFVAREEL